MPKPTHTKANLAALRAATEDTRRQLFDLESAARAFVCRCKWAGGRDEAIHAAMLKVIWRALKSPESAPDGWDVHPRHALGL